MEPRTPPSHPRRATLSTPKMLSPIKDHQNGLPKPLSLHQPRAPSLDEQGKLSRPPESKASPRRHMHDHARFPSDRCLSCMKRRWEAFKSPSLSF
jgi:hypothetical protein